MTLATTQRGDIAIYTAVIVVTIMLSGALAMGTILSRQIPATAQLLDAERAFYAANGGREQGFFIIAKQGNSAGQVLNQRINYSNSDAVYTGKLQLKTITIGGKPIDFPCGIIEGTFNSLKRRIAVGADPETNCP